LNRKSIAESAEQEKEALFEALIASIQVIEKAKTNAIE